MTDPLPRDHFTPQTVLLVEDRPDDVLLIQRAFRRAQLNHLIQVVTDGEQAIAYLAGHGSYAERTLFPMPSLVLLDLKLPKISGLEVLEWIRRQPGLKRLSVIVLTSSHLPQDINRAYDLGANSYLVKPIEFDTLVHVVELLDQYWIMLSEKPELG